MKMKHIRPYSLPRALSDSGVTVDRSHLGAFLEESITCFQARGETYSDDDRLEVGQLLAERHTDTVRSGYDLGHVAVALTHKNAYVAGTHLYGSLGHGVDHPLVADVVLTNSFSVVEKPEEVTSQYGKRLRPALLAEVGGNLVDFYRKFDTGVRFWTEPANPRLSEYYATHGFVDTNEIGHEGMPLMKLDVNDASIRQLQVAAHI